jgi:hypothetical protein
MPVPGRRVRPSGNPLVADRVDTTTGTAGLWLVEDIAHTRAAIASGSWIEAGLATATVGLDGLATTLDPVGSLASMGAGWLIEHVKPLSDPLDWLAGDPDQVAAYAQTWRNVAAHAEASGLDMAEVIRRDTADWSGLAAAAYRAHSSEQVTALGGLSQAAAAIGDAVERAGQLVATVRMIVRDLVAECVATLVVRLPEWLAVEGLTLGLATPWVISQVASLVSKWAARIARFLDGLIRSLGQLIPLLRRLADLLGQLQQLLARLARTDPTTPRATDEGPPGAGPPDQAGSGTPGDGGVDPQRLDELSRDPAHGGRITERGREEAMIGLDLEQRGLLPGPITRDPSGGAEFRDGTGQYWDIKGFNSNFPPRAGGYELNRSLDDIGDSLLVEENVIIDTRSMSDDAVRELRAAVEARPDWAGKVLWWP